MVTPEVTGDKPQATASAGEKLRVLLTWLVVAIPAVWGVAQVVRKALALFR